MKRFIFKILLLFIIPFAVLLSIQEVALRSVPNDYSYKNKWLTQNAKSVHILTLGSSHGFFGIQPLGFSKLAFNAGHVSQSLEFDAFIFDKFVDSMDSLEVVVLPISYFTLRSKGLQNGQEKWRVKNYTIYYDCPYYKHDPSFAFECYQFAPKATLKALFTDVNHISCDSLGRGTDYTLDLRSDDWQESGPSAMKRHTCKKHDKATLERNIEYINHIITKCEQKGIKVILLTTPTYHTYYDILDKDQLQQTIMICKKIAKEHQNTTYYNWLMNPDFNEHDFFDADHLNEYGAVKLSKLLDREIAKL